MRIQKNEDCLSNLWDNFKQSKIQIIGVPEGEEEEQGIENLFEKNNEGELPQTGKGNRHPGSPGSSESPKKLVPRKHTPRHIIITLPKIKDKEKILKPARVKETVTYKEAPIRLSAVFSKEIVSFQIRRDWKEVFKVMKSKELHPRLLYPGKLSFRMEGQIKCFPEEVKLKEFIITKPLLYEMLKGLI